jgi:eukaryotic-like serine/threonine-protein kinase
LQPLSFRAAETLWHSLICLFSGRKIPRQKILALRNFAPADPLMSLAHLGPGRTYALQGDSQKSRIAYQDFFTLWKDADPDIPIPRQAKAEYAKLQ